MSQEHSCFQWQDPGWRGYLFTKWSLWGRETPPPPKKKKKQKNRETTNKQKTHIKQNSVLHNYAAALRHETEMSGEDVHIHKYK